MIKTITVWRPRARIALAAVLGLLAMGALAAPASAEDRHPCYEKRSNGVRTFTHDGTSWRTQLYVCPLWRGKVPVHYTTDPGSPVVGHLTYGGHANWFVVAKVGKRYTLDTYWHTWWASTMADNGRWGWVSQAYFSGGDDDERDDGLLEFGGATCVQPCSELPPWYAPPAWSQNKPY